MVCCKRPGLLSQLRLDFPEFACKILNSVNDTADISLLDIGVGKLRESGRFFQATHCPCVTLSKEHSTFVELGFNF